MSRKKWVSAVSKGNQQVAPLTDEEKARFADEEIVLLLSGFNNFGDKIYNYIKLPLKKVESLIIAVEAGGRFDIRDFGEVIAAGLDIPTDEVKQEIESTYKMITFSAAEPPPESEVQGE